MTILINIFWLVGIISVALAAGYSVARKRHKGKIQYPQIAYFGKAGDHQVEITESGEYSVRPVETPGVLRKKKRRGRPRKKNNDT